MNGLWFPRVLGSLAALLALLYATSCLLIPPAAGDQVALGHRLTGTAGWIASAIHAVFFAWVAFLCFTRRRAATWAVIGYCVYLIENIWVYSTGEGAALFPRTTQLLLTNSLITGLLLVLCRVVLNRRAVFDR